MKTIDRLNLNDDVFKVTVDEYNAVKDIHTMQDTVILRIIEQEAKTASGIILSDKDIEKSTIGVVLKANKVSYHRNGDPTTPTLLPGDIVRLQRGEVGTTMSEAPDGQKWVAVQESSIYYFHRIEREAKQ